MISFLVLLVYQTQSRYVKSEMKITHNSPTLETLTHHRWAIPIIALLHAERGAKFVQIVNRLQLSRDALTRSLTALNELGWVQRNAGYGHPLRPEYILTPSGTKLGEACFELNHWLESNQLQESMLNKWSLPVLLAARSESRFSDLKRALPSITARALSSSLETLVENDLLNVQNRRYQLTERGLEAMTHLKEINQALSNQRLESA